MLSLDNPEKKSYICNVWKQTYIFAKVFSCPLWEIRSFNDRGITMALSARALVMWFTPVLGAALHIRPSVECYQ